MDYNRGWGDPDARQNQQDWADNQHPTSQFNRPTTATERPPYQDYLPKQEETTDRSQFNSARPTTLGPQPNQQQHPTHPYQHQYSQHSQHPYQPSYGQTHQHLVDYQNSKFNASTYGSPQTESDHQFNQPNHHHHPVLHPVRPQPEFNSRAHPTGSDGRLSWRPSVVDDHSGTGQRFRPDGLASPDPNLPTRSPVHQQFNHQTHHPNRFDNHSQYNYNSDPAPPPPAHPTGPGPAYYYQNGPQSYSPSHHNTPAQPANFSPVQHHQASYGYPSPLTGSSRPGTGSDYIPAMAASVRTNSFANSPLVQQQSFANQQDEHHSIYSYSGPGSVAGSTGTHQVPLPSGSSTGSLTRPPTRTNSLSDPVPAGAPPQSLAYSTPISQISRRNSPAPRQYIPAPLISSSLASHPAAGSPLIPSPAIPHVHAASSLRRIFRSRPPPLTFNPAREPSASARLSKTLTSQGLVVPAQGTKGKAVLEIVGSCWTCGEPSCKVILRGQDLSFSPRLTFTCLACVPEVDRSQSPEGDSKRAGSKRSKPEEKEAVYSDTLSAAVDVIEGADIRREEEETPEVTCSRLPETLKPQGMKCDVCDRIVGCGTIAPADPHAGPAPPFTSEVICSRCTERYRACSDCGGGGGRLTPGRWRCKELFPQGRRTCQLSHARNPPLNEITYHVLPIGTLNHETLEDLKGNCRQLYFNTRLRVTARPEMLERGDGLCRTFAEAEKLTIDGWNLLQPLMEVDIEREKGIRRYVAVQYSIPHRRRAKSKNEPPPEEVTERTVSGFMLVEYEFSTGSVYFAVVMPWALSGDAFDATTRLAEQVITQCRADLALANEERAKHGLQGYPPLSWNWGITPFKKESRMTQSLTRRGFVFLDELIASGEMPEEDLPMFPGYGHREIHVPKEFIKAFHIFARPLADGVAVAVASQGSTPGAKRVRQRVRKRAL